MTPKQITLRQARRKFGTRTTRRRNTNGKGIPMSAKGTKGRLQCTRYPKPAKRLGPKIHAYMKSVNGRNP